MAAAPLKSKFLSVKARAPAAARKTLASLLKLPQWKNRSLQEVGTAQKHKDVTIQHYLLNLDDTWTLPLTEYTPPRPRGTELLIADGGRSVLAAPLATALAQGRRVLVADILATGELRTDPRHQMLVAAAGQRPLGIQVGQVLALLATAS